MRRNGEFLRRVVPKLAPNLSLNPNLLRLMTNRNGRLRLGAEKSLIPKIELPLCVGQGMLRANEFAAAYRGTHD